MSRNTSDLAEVEQTDNTVRVEIIVSRTVPQDGKRQNIIGYWPEHILDEIKRRGTFPMVRVMWPEDFELLTSGRAAQIASQVANNNIAEDPLVSAVADVATAKAVQIGQASRPPFLMKLEDYANRCGYSVAFIKRLIPRGLPTLGVHKARRVHVARADLWLEQNLDDLDITESKNIEDIAKANAKRGSKK